MLPEEEEEVGCLYIHPRLEITVGYLISVGILLPLLHAMCRYSSSVIHKFAREGEISYERPVNIRSAAGRPSHARRVAILSRAVSTVRQVSAAKFCTRDYGHMSGFLTSCTG